jgi:hypothetical protein
MTKDDIIRMAREVHHGVVFMPEELIQFAELVAAAEREECIKALEANEQFYCRDTILSRVKK